MRSSQRNSSAEQEQQVAMPSVGRALFILLVALRLDFSAGLCYLIDANANCPVCWRTNYRGPQDNIGVTFIERCPTGISAEWEVAPPDEMVSQKHYKTAYRLTVDPGKFRLTDREIPHANIHSCIANRGVCSPFVDNVPGLSTHTAALTADVDHHGNVSFVSDLVLTQDTYTIIAHFQFLVHDDVHPELPAVQYDVCIGVSRTVQPQSDFCDDGSVLDLDNGTCTPCPPGTHESNNECVPCEKGSHNPLEGLASCLPCSEGFAETTGKTTCTPCPANSHRLPASPGQHVNECQCNFGFYAAEGLGRACLPCPVGAFCRGGLEAPYPRPLFWGDADCIASRNRTTCPLWDTFFACEDCAGGSDFACAEGRRGRLCKEAENDYFVVGGRYWSQCGRYGKLVSAAGILGVLMVWIAINAKLAQNYDALDVALLYLQITGMVSTFGLGWHPYLETVNVFLSIANFDVDFVAPLCFGPWTPVSSFYTQLLLPFLYIAGYATYLVVCGACERQLWTKQWAEHFVNQTVSRFLSFLIIVYHTLCLKCFQAFPCQMFPDGQLYLKAAPTLKCYSRDHVLMATAASLYIVILLLGAPTALLYTALQAKRERKLHSPQILERFGPILARYQPPVKWWECVVLLRRALVAVISTAIDIPMLQGALGVLLLLGFLVLHLHCRPFVSADLNVLDTAALIGAVLYSLAGMLFYVSISPDAQGEICGATEALEEPAGCKGEGVIKNWISALLLCNTLGTLLLATFYSARNVREVKDSFGAFKIVRESAVALAPSQDPPTTPSYVPSLTFLNDASADDTREPSLAMPASPRSPQAEQGTTPPTPEREPMTLDRLSISLALPESDEDVLDDACGEGVQVTATLGISDAMGTPQRPGSLDRGRRAKVASPVSRLSKALLFRQERRVPHGKRQNVIRRRFLLNLTQSRESSVSKSKNRVELHDLLEGASLLRWAKALNAQSESVRMRWMRGYVEVNDGVLHLPEDVTHFSVSELANALRWMSALPGIIDCLVQLPRVERTAALKFIESYSDFRERAHISKTGQFADKDPDPHGGEHPLSRLVLEEHRSVVVFWLLRCPEHKLEIARELLRSMVGTDKGMMGNVMSSVVLDFGRSFGSLESNFETRSIVTNLEAGDEDLDVCWTEVPLTVVDKNRVANDPL